MELVKFSVGGEYGCSSLRFRGFHGFLLLVAFVLVRQTALPSSQKVPLGGTALSFVVHPIPSG